MGKRIIGWVAAIAIWVPVSLSVYELIGWPILHPLFTTSSLLVMSVRIKRLSFVWIAIAVTICISATRYVSLAPLEERAWLEDVSVLPEITVNDSILSVKHLRNFEWSGPDGYDSRWKNERYDLDRLEGMELIVEQFNEREFMAHVMLGFFFSDGKRLIVSAEARKEIGEEYGLLAGALRQFELIYVFGTESDTLTQRAVYRDTPVYAYPIAATQEFARSLLLDLSESANELRATPRFYATLRRNCTTALLAHVDSILDEPIGFRYEILFPAKTGRLLHAMGLMDTELEFEEAKVAFRIDEKARVFAHEARFSELIRER